MKILVSGSLAYDRIMDFPGRFSDHILPGKIHILNVCFTINGLRENFGGTAGNIAYGLALLGEHPLILAAAGRDFGRYREWLALNGLPTDQITVVDEELTAGAYITTDRSDNQITAFNPGAMKHTARSDFGALDPRRTLAVVAPGNLEDMLRFTRVYKEKGIDYIFDPGQSLTGWGSSDLVEMIRGSRIFISNDYELELTQEKIRLDVDGLLSLTGALITTRAERGSIVRTAAGGGLKSVEIPAVRATAVKDPTGAGDAFRAGLVKGLLLADGDIVHAARMGAAAAVHAVEVYGTQTYRFTSESFNRRFREAFGCPAF
jgi:adenosine kinase